jgi:glycosyltransferase involved in cell wall biosynthesis
MRLVALVVTHNRQDQLRLTLTRLLADPVDAVVVVNNASTDGTAAWLATLTDPRLHVMALDQNHGGAGGFEQGLRAVSLRWMMTRGPFPAPSPAFAPRLPPIPAGRRWPPGSFIPMAGFAR